MVFSLNNNKTESVESWRISRSIRETGGAGEMIRKKTTDEVEEKKERTAR